MSDNSGESSVVPTRAVYYDTSVYVRLNPPTLRRLIEAEVANGIQAVAHPVVIGELLNKLSDPTSDRLKYDRPALQRLWDHCTSNSRLRVTPPIQIRVLRDLFGHVHPMHDWRKEMDRTIQECLNTLDHAHWSTQTIATVALCKDIKEKTKEQYEALKERILDSTSRFAAGEAMGHRWSCI